MPRNETSESRVDTHRRRRGVIAAAITVFLSLIVVPLLPIPTPAALRIPLGYLILAFLPGASLLLLIQFGRLRLTEFTLLSGVLSTFLSPAAGSLMMTLGMAQESAVRFEALGWSGLFAIACLVRGFRKPREPQHRMRWDYRTLILLILVALIVVALPHLLSPKLKMIWLSEMHAAFTGAIEATGLPPEDPYMAGEKLNYYWLFDEYALMLSRLCRLNVFLVFPIVAWHAMLNLLLGCLLLARRLALKRGSVILALFATLFFFNPAGWIWPLVHPVILGNERLLGQVTRVSPTYPEQTSPFYSSMRFGYDDRLVNWEHKYLDGNSFPLGLAFFVSFLWLMAGTVNRPARKQDGDPAEPGMADETIGLGQLAEEDDILQRGNGELYFPETDGSKEGGRHLKYTHLLAFLLLTGMIYLHAPTGVFTLAAGGLSLAAVFFFAPILRPQPSRVLLAFMVLPFFLAAGAALPYLADLSGHRDDPAILFQPQFRSLWGYAWVSLLTLPLAVAAFRRRIGTGAPAWWFIGIMTALFSAASFLFVLPGNNQYKFVYFAYFCMVIPAAAGWRDHYDAAVEGHGERRTTNWRRVLLILLLLFSLPTALLSQFALARWPEEHLMNKSADALDFDKDEQRLFTWISDSVEQDAVFLDSPEETQLADFGGRMLYFGLWGGKENLKVVSGHTAQHIGQRAERLRFLYANGRLDGALLEELHSLDRPVYLVSRREKLDPAVLEAFRDQPGRLEPVLETETIDVYRVNCTGKSIRHVLLLTIDTLRPDYLGFGGYDRNSSPFIDQLLKNSVYFRRSFTPIPRTTQALASLLTGAYPHTTGVRWLFGRLGDQCPTIAEAARTAGWQTVAVVSNHLLTRERGLDRGFQIYDHGDDARNAGRTTDRVMNILSTADKEQSLFLWVHYIDPHVPYYPPVEMARHMSGRYWSRYRDHFGSIPGGVGQSAYPADLTKEEAVYHNPLSEPVNAHIRRLYAADIMQTDLAAARLVRWLERNFGPDWLVVFTSDHGESLGEHDYFWDHGDYVYNAGLHVPLGFVFPDGHADRVPAVLDDQISLVDVAPTLMELCGWQPIDCDPQTAEGRSLDLQLRGRTLPSVPLYAESGVSFFPESVSRRVDFDVPGRFRTVIDGGWKLIWTPGANREESLELFDLTADPGERYNLSESGLEQTQRLWKHLSSWYENDPAREGIQPPETSEQDMEALRSLGYVE